MANIMKALLRIEGPLLLLISLMWICSGQEPVLVECTPFNFHAIAKRTLFSADELVEPDELSLGTGCPATLVQLNEIHFGYPVNSCGIKMLMYADTIVFFSWLNYRPRHGFITAELQLECTVSRDSAKPDDSPIDIRLIQNPLAQRWFLVQYRKCQNCGKRHCQDTWSIPFYGPRNPQSS